MDGSDPATDWHGLLTVEESPHLLDPKSGYVFNVNDSPWNGAGREQLAPGRTTPAYVETGKESARGLHAMRLLQGKKDFTLDGLVAAAYDSYLPVVYQAACLGLSGPGSICRRNLPMKSSLRRPDRQSSSAWDLRWGVEFRRYLAGHVLGPEIAWRGAARGARRFRCTGSAAQTGSAGADQGV